MSRPALFELDRKLAPFLPQHDGFFVEAGAYDGYEQSNTYYLERFRNWRGVLVEPIPALYRECVRERPRALVYNCALVPDDFEGDEIAMRYGGLMSLVQGARGGGEEEARHVRYGNQFGWDENYQVTVPARTLTSILDDVAPATIDFMSLDAEGYEPEILKGLDLERYRPRLMLIEGQDKGADAVAIEAVIADHYELVEPLTPNDLLYAAKA
jgi:FkbM family methyltransferase